MYQMTMPGSVLMTAGTLRRIGRRPQADEHLTTATTMMREMEMGLWLEKAEADLKELG
jgi:hypothetical protein